MRIHRLVVPVLALAALAAASAPSHAAAPAAARAPAAPRMVLPFIHDDWPKAMALAKARKLPVFVEAWAPW